jgi:hypothetical protein
MIVRHVQKRRRELDARDLERQTKRWALRAAIRIHELLLKPPPTPGIALPRYEWTNCRKLANGIHAANQRGWHAASRYLSGQLANRIESLQRQLASVASDLEPPPAVTITPIGQIYEDILALDAEFDEAEIDLDETKISVTTDPIRLKDLYLGPFKIVLNWGEIGVCSSPYEVIATDPQPSARDNDVVHPHVRGVDLCEGDARMPIRHALRQGRLFDFFLIVRQTLETYNAGSPHVAIDEWDGQHCDDCGTSITEDESYSCDRCFVSFCSECSIRCSRCGNTSCNSCGSTCEACDRPHCSACLAACNGCRRAICKECLSDGKCSDCRESESDEQERQEQGADGVSGGMAAEAVADADADAPLHADCVGEAGVPA